MAWNKESGEIETISWQEHLRISDAGRRGGSGRTAEVAMANLIATQTVVRICP